MSYGKLFKLFKILEDKIEEIKNEAYEEGYNKGYKNGYKDGKENKNVVKKSLKNVREDIIDMAKKDVEKLISDCKSLHTTHHEYGGNFYYYNDLLDVEFVVNKEKRTVVALLKLPISGKVANRGIAKCNPTDCFDENIGMAIALRRALGLSVKKEYLNVPNEDKCKDCTCKNGYRVGDIVTFPEDDDWHMKVLYRIDSIDKKENNLTIIKDDRTDSISCKGYKISCDFDDNNVHLVIVNDKISIHDL